MKKLAWPWIGTPEHEMGSMPSQGKPYRDMQQESSVPYDTLVTEKHNVEGNQPYGYQSGMISPVQEDPGWDEYWEGKDTKMEPEEVSDELLSRLKDGALVLDVGCGDGTHASYMVDNGMSVIGIDKSATAMDKAPDTFKKVVGDIRYHDFQKRFDGFQALSSLEYIDDYPLALKNIYRQLRPTAFGLVHLEKVKAPVDKFRRAIKDAGFTIVKESELLIGDSLHQEFILEKDESNKTANVSILSKNGQIEFSCDVVTNLYDKMAGLQVYSGLSDNSGLLFKYNSPTDVLYHMGTVSFPIDILFIDQDRAVKKIVSDIQPGTLGVFGAAGVKYVLEVKGGSAKKYSIDIGDEISLIKGSLNKTASLSDSPEIIAFDVDSLLEEMGEIKVFSTHYPQDEKEASWASSVFEAVSIDLNQEGQEIFNTFKFGSMPNESSLHRKGWSIILSRDKSFNNFLSKNGFNTPEVNNFIDFIKSNKGSNLVLVTKHGSSVDQLRRLVCHRLWLDLGYIPTIQVLAVSHGADNTDKIRAIGQRYTTSKIKLFESSKTAGSPIPMYIKEKASQAGDIFKKSTKILDKFLENMQKNVIAYEGMSDKVEGIPKTKEQYKASMKRNASIIEEHLKLIRSGVELMDEIKDISTTTQINMAVINASKKISEGAEDIFNLIDKMDSPDFYMFLSDKTKELERRVDESGIVVGRMINYINSDILGIVVISD